MRLLVSILRLVDESDAERQLASDNNTCCCGESPSVVEAGEAVGFVSDRW